MAVSAVRRGKSNCAKVAIAALGNYPSGFTVHLTKSMSRSYLGGGLLFLYDDPSNVDVLKEILIDAFGGARMSDQHKDQSAHCTPLVTVNEFVVDDLMTGMYNILLLYHSFSMCDNCDCNTNILWNYKFSPKLLKKDYL